MLKIFQSFSNRVSKQFVDGIEYDSLEFKQRLREINIFPGDSLFVMYSQDKIYKRCGKIIASSLILQDVLDYLGEDGNIMVLGFPLNRREIISHEKKFDARKSATECGIFAETLRRRKGAVRSFQPVHSAIAFGKKADLYCVNHHLSIYPYDESSPYYKITADGGKYLGIGVGFEAFTPCHMVDDYYKKSFKHKIYYDHPEKFEMIDLQGNESSHFFLNRNPATFPGDYDPLTYFDLLNVTSHQTMTLSGVSLFSFVMRDFLEAAVRTYDLSQKTVWDTGNWKFMFYKSFKNLGRFIKKRIKL
jgi:aminoglycoside N3'-acetyltransferase